MLVGMSGIRWDTFLAGLASGLGIAAVASLSGTVLYLAALVTLGVAGVLRARRQAKAVEAPPPLPVPPAAP
jgi:hypothetical protein